MRHAFAVPYDRVLRFSQLHKKTLLLHCTQVLHWVCEYLERLAPNTSDNTVRTGCKRTLAGDCPTLPNWGWQKMSIGEASQRAFSESFVLQVMFQSPLKQSPPHHVYTFLTRQTLSILWGRPFPLHVGNSNEKSLPWRKFVEG